MHFAKSTKQFGELSARRRHADRRPAADDARATPAPRVPRLVYLRCGMVDGQTAYAVHAADGTAIAVVDDVEVAVELVSDNHMIFVAVH